VNSDTAKDKTKAYKILSIDASELFDYVIKDEPFCICNEFGKIDFDKFTASIYNSLETKKLQSAYEEEKKNRKVKGSFELQEYRKCNQNSQSDKYGATLSVINITFRKSHKETKTNTEQLRALFYEKGIKIKTLRRKGEKDSPVINTYVRYKRSAGSSREGNCLFILEPLKKKMMKWSSCGFDESKISDKVSWESYISLTLSNAQCEITIPKEAILFIPDAESCFFKDVISVKTDGNKIVAAPEHAYIKNKIWDGQALLDESIFNENDLLKGKGMVLLRNRFFKTCAFNTKLQAWFKANGITNLSQLHPKGYTKAKNVSDIKLVVTYSSLKSIKLKQSELSDAAQKDKTKCEEKTKEAIELWLTLLEENFGVVKTEKPTHNFGGQMVQTSYQLINTLELGKDELAELTRPAQEYLSNMMNDPMYMRHYLRCNAVIDNTEQVDDSEYDIPEEESGEGDFEFTTLRKQVNFDLLSRNDEYSKTRFYDKFRQDIRRDYLEKMKKGRLLVHGTNATLFGNGYEMLSAITDHSFEFAKPAAIALAANEARSSFFADAEEILCARSPHVTMGNLFVAKNHCDETDVYATWFNLTPEIICVNSIEECLMDRLNGCDFDSDAMLITNNPIMLSAAKKHYSLFGVPVGILDAKRENKKTHEIDTDISNNKIGEIINTSQWLNSIFWDKKAKGVFDTELYYDICKLAVLSGIEIDKAKRNYGISAKAELELIKSRYKRNTDKEEFSLRPSFMKVVKKRESYSQYDAKVDPSSKYSDQYQTAMQLLQNVVIAEAKRKNYTPGKVNLSDFLCKSESRKLDNEYRYANEIIEELNKRNNMLIDQRKKLRWATNEEKEAIWEKTREIESQCVAFVKQKMKSDYVMRILIERLDGNDSRVTKFKSLLLSCICSANDNFYHQVSSAASALPRYELEIDPLGDIPLFGIYHSKLKIL
jgi:hypothetical protein